MSNMDEHIEELFAFYALGTLSDAERSQVEAYVHSDPGARQRLDEMIRTVSLVPQAITPMKPSAELKAKLMERVRADARARSESASEVASRRPGTAVNARRSSSGPRWAYAFAVASLLLAVGIGTWGLGVRSEIIRLQSQVSVLEQEVQTQRTVLAQLSLPQAHAFAISGTDHQPQAQGQLIADASTGSGVLVVSGLKPLTTGQTYEFWLINDATAVPAGLFKVNEQGQGVLQITQKFTSNSYNAIGVSIEPAGGSKAPTGDIVMLGKLN